MSDPVKQLDMLLKQNGFKLVRQDKHKVYKSVGLGGRVFVTSSTPSDTFRWAKNAITDLKQVIASPPRAEVLAIAEYERARASRIGMQKTERARIGLGSGGNHRSRGTGFIYVSKEPVELTPEQIAEKERIRLKREAEEAAWKAERQERREERKAREAVKARIEAAVNRGIDIWAARSATIQKDMDDEYSACLMRRLDGLDEAFATVRNSHMGLVERLRQELREGDPFTEEEKSFSPNVKAAAVAISKNLNEEETKRRIQTAIEKKSALRLGDEKHGFEVRPYAVPASIPSRLRRCLKSWFNAIEFGSPYLDYEYTDDDQFVGAGNVHIALIRATAPSPATILADLKQEKAHFDELYVGALTVESEGEECQTTFAWIEPNESEEIDKLIEDQYSLLGLVGVDRKHGHFYVKSFAAPVEVQEWRHNELLTSEEFKSLTYQEGWPERARQEVAA